MSNLRVREDDEDAGGMNLFPAYDSYAAGTQDAALEAIFGKDGPAPDAHRSWSPEQRLHADILTDAIREAANPKKPRHCDDARLWLRGADARLTAERCCEAIGLDYEAMMVRLERLWSKKA